jgi:hypothetical protein
MHAPPLADLPPQLLCNCQTAHFHDVCVLDPGGRACEFAAAELQKAQQSADKPRLTNKQNRFRCYCDLSMSLNGPLGVGLRQPLPLCAVSAVRQAWPEASGVYVGYKDAPPPAD